MKSIKLLFPLFLVFLILPSVNGQKLAKDAMVASWNFHPKAEVNLEEFESFVQENYMPALKKNLEGVEFFLLKNDRGTNEGGYTILAIFKSMQARNEWWPEKGQSSEKAIKALENMQKQEEKFRTMIELDSWNDWLVL